MYEVDRFAHKKKCDVVEYARLAVQVSKVFGGDGDSVKKLPRPQK